jgi:hypothetical protein
LGKQSLGIFSPTQHVDDPILITSVQGSFYGATLPSLGIEMSLAAHLPRSRFKATTDFYTSRWWDYRRLSPGHSFYLFTHHYYSGVRLAARKFIKERRHEIYTTDRNRSKAIVGAAINQYEVEEVWTMNKAHITGLWSAMLIADSFGFPYDEFVRLTCLVAFERHWTHIPRTTQLYSDKLTPYVLDTWEEIKKDRLFLAKHPMYDEENYVALPVQDAYRQYVIEHIGMLDKPLNGIMSAVFHRRQLPERMARDHFPSQIVDRAKLLAG